MSNKYTGDDLTVLIPTKDRPEKVHNLLRSLNKQTTKVRRIIVVDGGDSVENILDDFTSLPVEHHLSDIPGQIHQRNLGISKIDTPIVIFFDDDIVLEEKAVEEVLRLWNNSSEKVAAISFNITNTPKWNPNKFLTFFRVLPDANGRMLSSGYATPITNIGNKIIKTDWVIGGATSWKTDVLKRHPQKEINTPWAVNEDKMYSYPIGKNYTFYVCGYARVRHEHVVDQYKKNGNADYFKRGFYSSVWRVYFVSLHNELSIFGCTKVEFARIIVKLVNAITRLDRSKLLEAKGLFFGVVKALLYLYKKQSLLGLIDNK